MGRKMQDGIDELKAAKKNILNHIDDPMHVALRMDSILIALAVIEDRIETEERNLKYYETKIKPYISE